jgi:hypothetical protein
MDEVDQIGQKELLELLNTLNDAEIIILKYYSLNDDEDRSQFRRVHHGLFDGVGKDFKETLRQSSQTENDREALRDRYTKILLNEALLNASLEYTRYQTTALGQLFLRYIDLAPPNPQ